MVWIYSQAQVLLLLAPALVLALAVHMAAKPHAPLPWRSEAPPGQVAYLVEGTPALPALSLPWSLARRGNLGWTGPEWDGKGGLTRRRHKVRLSCW